MDIQRRVPTPHTEEAVLADELAEEQEAPGWLPGGKVAPVSLGLTAAELASYMHIHLTVDVFGM